MLIKLCYFLYHLQAQTAIKVRANDVWSKRNWNWHLTPIWDNVWTLLKFTFCFHFGAMLSFLWGFPRYTRHRSIALVAQSEWCIFPSLFSWYSLGFPRWHSLFSQLLSLLMLTTQWTGKGNTSLPVCHQEKNCSAPDNKHERLKNNVKTKCKFRFHIVCVLCLTCWLLGVSHLTGSDCQQEQNVIMSGGCCGAAIIIGNSSQVMMIMDFASNDFGWAVFWQALFSDWNFPF